MSEHELPPLGPSASALLDAERRRGDDAPDRADRIYERLTTSVALGAPGVTTHPSGDGAPASAASLVSKKMAAVALGVFVAGGAVGAALHARLAAPASPPQTLTPPAPSVAPPAESTAAVGTVTDAGIMDAQSAVRAEASVLPRASAPRPVGTLGDRDVDLSRERATIDRARMAIARHDSTEALAALDEHARLFPSGRLAEEREALAIGALADLGRLPEARARAARFKKLHPASVFAPAVDAALERANHDAAP